MGLLDTDTIKRFEKMVESLNEVKNSKNLEEKCATVRTLISELTQSDEAIIYTYDKENRQLSSIGMPKIELDMKQPQGCIGKVFLTKKAEIYNYLVSDKDYVASYDNPLGSKLRAKILMPLVEDENLVAIVSVARMTNGNKKPYARVDLEALTAIQSFLLQVARHLCRNHDLPYCVESANRALVKMAQKEEGEFIKKQEELMLYFSNVVHDIRTPANSLHGFLELLEEKIKDQRLKEFVVNAKESAEFINELVTSILESIKHRYISAAKKEEAIATVRFLADLANTFSANMLNKKLYFFIYISPDIPKEIKIDAMKLKRILINLIGNAYKFTPPKGEVWFNALWDASSKTIRFSIKDTGMGIEKEDQKRLFKAFEQAFNSYEEHGGTGLGLSICAKYVAEMGGELKLKSKVGKGSEFYFEIPVEVVDADPAFKKFYNLKKKIVILTEYTEAKYPKFLRNYLVDFGMPKEKITISTTLDDDATHVICFEEKVSDEIIEAAQEKRLKLLIVEQRPFSLLSKKGVKVPEGIKITSKDTYNGDALHSTVYSGKRIKVLIVDDNKINIQLLVSILEAEYVDITTAMDGKDALGHLYDAVKSGEPFDIVYLDKHLPGISGTELLEKYRAWESRKGIGHIHAVSITGDTDFGAKEKALFDAFVNKPFHKDEVREVLKAVKKLNSDI